MPIKREQWVCMFPHDAKTKLRRTHVHKIFFDRGDPGMVKILKIFEFFLDFFWIFDFEPLVVVPSVAR